MYASNVCRRVSNDFSSKGSVLVMRVKSEVRNGNDGGERNTGSLAARVENCVGPFEHYHKRVGPPRDVAVAHKRKRCVQRTHLVSRKSSKTRKAKNLTSIGCFRSPF